MPFYFCKNSSELSEGDVTHAAVQVDGRKYELALVRLNGKVSALDDRCPHAGASLSSGFLSGNALACPLHAWEFNVENGECTHFTQCKVETFSVREVEGKIEVEILTPV
jgi:nitrite reductase (NADH) small subunit